MKAMKAFPKAIVGPGINNSFRQRIVSKRVNGPLVGLILFSLMLGPWLYYMTANPTVLIIIFNILASLFFCVYWYSNQQQLRKLEGEKEELEQQLLKALHANDSKKNFIREVVHEIKSGFNPIEGMVAYLSENERLQKAKVSAEQLVAHIKGGCFSYRRLLSNLLEYSKLEYGRNDDPIVEPLVIRSFMQQVVDEFQYTAHAEQTLILLQVEEAVPPVVHCDPIKLRQIANNLIHNAIKFVRVGCDIIVKVDLSGSNTWQLAVIHEGENISDEKLQKIFYPYQHVRTGINMEGNGLGLFITRNLVETLHGQIGVIRGKVLTVFEVKFPLQQRQPLEQPALVE